MLILTVNYITLFSFFQRFSLFFLLFFVIIKLYQKSNHSLYIEEYATFEEDEVYNQKDAEGFINLFGLQTKMKAIVDAKNK